MTCSNWGITILSLLNIVLVMWPNILGTYWTEWIVALSSLVVIIIVWTSCNCKWCPSNKAMAQIPVKAKRKKRK